MAVYCEERDTLFIGGPKIGNHWVERCLRNLRPTGIQVRHHPLERDRTKARIHKHMTLLQWVECYGFIPKHVFTFVRNPLDWYRSFWKYQLQQEGGWNTWERFTWHPLSPVGRCSHNTFEDFLRSSLEMNGGFVSRMYEWYAGPEGMERVVVGRLEYGANSLIACLTLCGWSLDTEQKHIIESTIPQNETPVQRAEWLDMEYTMDVLSDEVLRMEYPAIRRFYDH